MAKRYFCNVYDCLKLMLPPGRTTKVASNRVNDKLLNVYLLNKSSEEIREDLDNNIIKTEKQRNVLEFLLNNDKSTMQDIEMFTDATLAVVNALIKKGYVKKESVKVERNPFIHKVIWVMCVSDSRPRSFRAAKRSVSNWPRNSPDARPAVRSTYWTNRPRDCILRTSGNWSRSSTDWSKAATPSS